RTSGGFRMTHRSSGLGTARNRPFTWRSRRCPAGVTIAALVTLAIPGRSGAICNTSLCTFSGSTCTISSSYTIDDGCLLALQAYDVTVTKPATLSTALAGDSWTLDARSLTVFGTLKASEGTLTILTTNGVTTDKTNNSPAKLEAASGTIVVVAGGPVQLGGTLVIADGVAGDDGGVISIAG